jgi:putative acetyltransferase
MRRGGGTLLIEHARRQLGGPLRVDVNEANLGAIGFYVANGFSITGRSAVDDEGRPFPLLHMKETITEEHEP